MSVEGKPGVLLVEDDKAYHVLVEDVLGPDYDVTAVDSVEAAHEQIRKAAAGQAAFRTIVLDFHLDNNNATRADETGIKVLEDVRAQLGEGFPVIGFSARSMKDIHRVDGLYADVTKDGLFDLPEIIRGIPNA